MPPDSPIRVYPIKFGDRRFYQLQWIDPRTGRKRTQSARCTKRRDADRAAAELEAALNDPGTPADGSIDFMIFADRFCQEHVLSLSPGSQKAYGGLIQLLIDIVTPCTLRELDSRSLSQFAAARRKSGVSESTIAKDLRHLRAMLAWAHSQGLISSLPAIPRVTKSRTAGDEMKGRPLTDDEFVRLLAAAHTTGRELPTVAHRTHAEHLLRGLWLSGLRITEAFQLQWSAGPWISLQGTGTSGVLSLLIPGRQKSGKYETAPLTPDFSQFILTARSPDLSHVFTLLNRWGHRTANADHFTRVVSAIGRESGIITDPASGQTASAHDLRRSFGARWSVKVMPVVLRALMRHASIDTTMRYYVGQNLSRTEDAILKAFTADNTPASQTNSLANT